MIKTIYFDLGGVVVNVDSKSLITQLAQSSSLDPKVIFDDSENDPARIKLELGQISLYDFYVSLRKNIDLTLSFTEFEHLFCNIFTPNKQIVHTIEKLVNKYQIGIISNTSEAHYLLIEQQITIIKKLKPIILSCRVQALKPGREIFDIAIIEAGCAPSEILFIDDKATNTAAASILGLDIIHFTEMIDLENELRTRGIIIH